MHIEDNPRQLEYIGIIFFLTGSFRFHFGVNVLANSNTFTYIYNGRPPAPNSIPPKSHLQQVHVEQDPHHGCNAPGKSRQNTTPCWCYLLGKQQQQRLICVCLLPKAQLVGGFSPPKISKVSTYRSHCGTAFKIILEALRLGFRTHIFHSGRCFKKVQLFNAQGIRA